MNTQVLLVIQEFQHRVWDRPNAHLHGRPIWDQVSTIAGNLFGGFVAALAAHGHFGERVIYRDNVVDTAEMDERVAQAARHLLVNLSDDHRGRLCRRFGQASFDAKAAEAMFIGWREVYQSNINRQDSVLEHQRKFREQNRREVGTPFLDGLADIGADEQRVHPQVAFHLWANIIGRTHRQSLSDFNIFQVRRMLNQGRQHHVRGGAVTRQENALPGLDFFNGVLSSNDAGLIDRLEIHKIILPPPAPSRHPGCEARLCT